MNTFSPLALGLLNPRRSRFNEQPPRGPKPGLPRGTPANEPTDNVIDHFFGPTERPWRTGPVGPLGPGGPANDNTGPNAPVEQIYRDPFVDHPLKYPEGFDPSPGSGQPIEPADILGKFGAKDPILDPMGGASGFGGVPGLTPWVQKIGPPAHNSPPWSQADASWQIGTQGAETPSGQNYAPDPATQVDPGGYNGGAYGGMGGFTAPQNTYQPPPMDFGGGGGGGYGGGQDPFGGGNFAPPPMLQPPPVDPWFSDPFGGGGGPVTGLKMLEF